MSDKLSELAATEDEELEMDMSPMIDMVFLLLIFFMVTSTIIVNRLDPDVKIPVGDKAEAPEEIAGRVVINVYEDGSFKGEDPKKPAIDESGITDLVAEMKREHSLISGVQTRVLIRADQAVPLEYVKKAVAASAAAGVIDIIFAAYQNAPGN